MLVDGSEQRSDSDLVQAKTQQSGRKMAESGLKSS